MGRVTRTFTDIHSLTFLFTQQITHRGGLALLFIMETSSNATESTNSSAPSESRARIRQSNGLHVPIAETLENARRQTLRQGIRVYQQREVWQELLLPELEPFPVGPVV